MVALHQKVWRALNHQVVPTVKGHPVVVSKEVTFTETAGAGTYTGSVDIPAGATILDIQVHGVALWNASGAVTMIVGDAANDDGFFTGIDMKATDLLAGEVIRFGSTGGKEGAYLVTATGFLSPVYSASARVISGIISAAGTAGTTGRTRMLVIYAPASPNAVSAATKA